MKKSVLSLKEKQQQQHNIGFQTFILPQVLNIY